MKEYSVSYKNLTRKMKEVYKDRKRNARNITSFVRSETIRIETFHELVMEIAELSYKNPEVMLFYRGQNKNHVKTKYSTLYPTIYRSTNKREIDFEFKILEKSASKLIKEIEQNESIDNDEITEIKKIKLLQYSILQHYEVCKTPLLDLTQSLKVACSFAVLNNEEKIGYIYVLALPYIKGRISVDSEDYITNVRLLSISCSASKRPFFQEGYLVQTEFTSDSDIEKGDLDFNRRIVAIYEFKDDKTFWQSENPISVKNLYPDNDIMKDICSKIESEKFYLDNNLVDKKLIGDFLTLWNKLEKLVRFESKNNNFWSGLLYLLKGKDKKYEKNMKDIDRLRRFRNKLVHGTDEISDEEINNEIKSLEEILKKLSVKYW